MGGRIGAGLAPDDGAAPLGTFHDPPGARLTEDYTDISLTYLDTTVTVANSRDKER
jgi:hypothetical protein